MKGRQSGMPDEEYWGSFFDAECVLSRLECENLEGDIVEFGCGYGIFTVAAARRTRGTVYGLDIDPEMVSITQEKSARYELRNVVAEQRDFLASGCGLPDQSVLYAMLFNILHIEEPVALLREALRVLKPGGRVGVIHWNHDPATPRGPSMDIRPRPEQCQKWAEEAGFARTRFEAIECCTYHYGLVLQSSL